ncbi:MULTISPECIES: hypothetical protein [Photobacterium]|nr:MULTISPECIES: hypothetical protein [Photobacterium]WEM44601.1 hypothetical protein PTW35_25400 [Photobacterium sp. DA100]
MKKKVPSEKSHKDNNKNDKPNNIHQVRRKIEDILLEREQKKLLDL